MAEQPTFTQGLTSFLTPLATVGAGAYQTQAKSQINAARIRAGKQPCTGTYDQPPDCPSIFSPQAVTPAADGGGSANDGGGSGGSLGISPVVIVGLLLGAGVIVMLLMSKKAPATTAARRRKKSRK